MRRVDRISGRRPTRRRARLATIVLAACATVIGTTSLGQAAPPSDETQPLPGWTISQPTISPIAGAGGQTTVYQGVSGHAGYYAEVPTNWNGELVMYAHGYRGKGTTLYAETPALGMRELLVSQGYAWASSSYYANGYDVKAGVESTHDLAVKVSKEFTPKKPKRTYLIGVSMGGHIAARSLEEYPNFYSGAMPVCGAIGDAELFDYFLDYNLSAQALAGVVAYPPPADYVTGVVPQIQQKLGIAGMPVTGEPSTPEGMQLRDVTIELSGGQRPGANASFAFWKDALFGYFWPDDGGPLSYNPGRIAQNVKTVYSPDSPVDLNSVITRVAPADPASRASKKLTQIPAIEGKPKVPVLSLHNIGDMFVPLLMEQEYAKDVAANGQSSLLVQRVTRTAGHCEFAPSELATAWNDLRTWVEADGVPARAAARPQGDDVLDPAAVAAPTYGCRFTDPAAYGTGTRALFAPCAAA